MEYIYVFAVDGAEWEDIIVYLSEEEALESSRNNPNVRLEIFQKLVKGGYHPTYNYYLGGKYIETH